MFHQLQANEPASSATFTQSSKCLQALPEIFSRNEQEGADEYFLTYHNMTHYIDVLI